MKHTWIKGRQVKNLRRLLGYPVSQLPDYVFPVLLHTGAKLYRERRGAVIRYFIGGYACDGSDTDKIVAEVSW